MLEVRRSREVFSASGRGPLVRVRPSPAPARKAATPTTGASRIAAERGGLLTTARVGATTVKAAPVPVPARLGRSRRSLSGRRRSRARPRRRPTPVAGSGVSAISYKTPSVNPAREALGQPTPLGFPSRRHPRERAARGPFLDFLVAHASATGGGMRLDRPVRRATLRWHRARAVPGTCASCLRSRCWGGLVFGAAGYAASSRRGGTTAAAPPGESAPIATAGPANVASAPEAPAAVIEHPVPNPSASPASPVATGRSTPPVRAIRAPRVAPKRLDRARTRLHSARPLRFVTTCTSTRRA